jgi:hypothetical protein
MKTNQKPVHFRDDQFANEDLLYPIVLYPTHYGTFLAFKKDEKSEPTLCTCSAEAIENYIIYNLNDTDRGHNVDPTRNFILDSFDFPKELVRFLINREVPQDLSLLNHLKFENPAVSEFMSQKLE